MCLCRDGVGVGCHFICTRNEGALLVLREPASREICLQLYKMKKHMALNIETWHGFARDVLNLDLKLEHIIFVTGVVKTTDCSVLAITRADEGSSAKVSFNGDFGNPVQVSFMGTTTPIWNSRSSVPPRADHQQRNHHKHSPQQSEWHRELQRQQYEYQQLEAHQPDGEQPLVAQKQKQCIFLHFTRAKKRQHLLPTFEWQPTPRDPPNPPDDDDDNEMVVEQVPPVDEVRFSFTCRVHFDKAVDR